MGKFGRLTIWQRRTEQTGNMKLQEYIRRNFPFKGKKAVQPQRRGKTLTELRAEMGDEKWDVFMKETVSQKMRAMAYLSDTERKWVAGHLPEFGDIMQQQIARIKYKKLPLLAHQKIWEDEHTEKSQPVSLTLAEKVLEIYLSETPTAKRLKALG